MTFVYISLSPSFPAPFGDVAAPPGAVEAEGEKPVPFLDPPVAEAAGKVDVTIGEVGDAVNVAVPFSTVKYVAWMNEVEYTVSGYT